MHQRSSPVSPLHIHVTASVPPNKTTRKRANNKNTSWSATDNRRLSRAPDPSRVDFRPRPPPGGGTPTIFLSRKVTTLSFTSQQHVTSSSFHNTTPGFEHPRRNKQKPETEKPETEERTAPHCTPGFATAQQSALCDLTHSVHHSRGRNSTTKYSLQRGVLTTVPKPHSDSLSTRLRVVT
jgi:hypothetical protein